MHETPARWLFQRGLQNDRESASYAYMLGAACHYALDTMCHPHVAEFEIANGVSHMEIESEFEKMLMRRNGLDPFTYRTDLLIATDVDTAEALYRFYGVYDTEKMQFVLRWMQNVKRLFIEPRKSRQAIVNKLLDITGFGSYKPQMLQLKDQPVCAASSAVLYQLCTEAVPYAVELLHELDNCKQNDEPLSEKWDKTFV